MQETERKNDARNSVKKKPAKPKIGGINATPYGDMAKRKRIAKNFPKRKTMHIGAEIRSTAGAGPVIVCKDST